MHNQQATQRSTAEPAIQQTEVSGFLPSGRPLPVSILELAEFDLRILTDCPLAFGTNINLMFLNGNSTDVKSNVATVHWCQHDSVGWQLGLHLHHSMRDHVEKHLQWELRHRIRFDCQWTGWARIDDIDAPHRILIRNYSLAGLMFESSAQFTIGDSLKISRSRQPNEGEYIIAELLRHDPSSHQFGCELQVDVGRKLPQLFNNASSIDLEMRFLSGLSRQSKLLPELPHDQSPDGFSGNPTSSFA